jgi:hypothetical protein
MNPLGPGVMEDSYSDRLDIMACCKGDYSIYNRWVDSKLLANAQQERDEHSLHMVASNGICFLAEPITEAQSDTCISTLHAFRILAGWVPASERALVTLEDVATPPAGGRTYQYVLWPYDRQESKGQLKAVTIRLTGDKVLVLGYRSVTCLKLYCLLRQS